MLREYLKDEQNVRKVFLGGLALAALLTLLRPWLPDGLVRMPEAWLLPWRDWIDPIWRPDVWLGSVPAASRKERQSSRLNLIDPAQSNHRLTGFNACRSDLNPLEKYTR